MQLGVEPTTHPDGPWDLTPQDDLPFVYLSWAFVYPSLLQRWFLGRDYMGVCWAGHARAPDPIMGLPGRPQLFLAFSEGHKPCALKNKPYFFQGPP